MRLKIALLFTLGLVSFLAFSKDRSRDPNLPSDALSNCGLHPKAVELARLIMKHPRQLRSKLNCHKQLAQIALAKAQEMANRRFVAHLLSVGPNQNLRNQGYPLARIYPGVENNQVEAIGGGYAKAKDMFQEFLRSKDHKNHLLGENDFYRLQDEIGVAYYRDPTTPQVDFWVIYIAHQDKHAPDKVLIPPSKGT